MSITILKENGTYLTRFGSGDQKCPCCNKPSDSRMMFQITETTLFFEDDTSRAATYVVLCAACIKRMAQLALKFNRLKK